MRYGRYDIVVKSLRRRDNWIPINTPLSSCADYPWFCWILWFDEYNDTKGCKLCMKIHCYLKSLTRSNKNTYTSTNTQEREREREWKQDSWLARANDPIFCNKRMVFVNKPKFVMVWHYSESCLSNRRLRAVK